MAFLNSILEFVMRKQNLNDSRHPVLNGHAPVSEDLQASHTGLSFPVAAAWPDEIDDDDDDDDIDDDDDLDVDEVEVTEEVEVDEDPDVVLDDDIDLDEDDDDEIDDI
jgi:hypothetical protein